jgi:hypothetical protein
MALKAEVTAVRISDTRVHLVVSVKYYDDGAPAVTLHTHDFTFPAAISLADARTKIQAYGAQVRERLAQQTTAAQSYVGQVINIP